MPNVLKNEDIQVTLNNVWIQLERLRKEVERKAGDENDMELLGISHTIANTARALNHAQYQMEERGVSGVELSTPS